MSGGIIVTASVMALILNGIAGFQRDCHWRMKPCSPTNPVSATTKTMREYAWSINGDFLPAVIKVNPESCPFAGRHHREKNRMRCFHERYKRETSVRKTGLAFALYSWRRTKGDGVKKGIWIALVAGASFAGGSAGVDTPNGQAATKPASEFFRVDPAPDGINVAHLMDVGTRMPSFCQESANGFGDPDIRSEARQRYRYGNHDTEFGRNRNQHNHQ